MKRPRKQFDARFLLCEDIRAEALGKISLIGVYVGERVVVWPLPGRKPTDTKDVAQIGPLAFVVVVSGPSGKYKTAFELVNPDGKRWGSKQLGKLEIKDDAASLLATRALQMLVPKFGQYVVRFSLDGSRFDFPFQITPAPKGAKFPAAFPNPK